MPLHDDHPEAQVVLDGKVIRNLTEEEYLATYTEPGTTGGHEIPADVLEQAEREADEWSQ